MTKIDTKEVNTILPAEWWQQSNFDGKEFLELSENWELRLSPVCGRPIRQVAVLSTSNADTIIHALIAKFSEASKRVGELAEEWAKSEDKLKLNGKVTRLREYLDHASAIGNFEALYNLVDSWDKEIQEGITINTGKRRLLVEEAEAISISDRWKDGNAGLRKVADDWRTIGLSDKSQSDELWKRFEAARDKFHDRRRAWQEEQEVEMTRNYDLKLEVAEKAEQLMNSEGWKETTELFRQLLDEWKAIGKTFPDKNEALWQRYMVAKNIFYDRKRKHFELIQAEQEENYNKKVLLVEKAEALQDSTDWQNTSRLFTEILEEWKAIGKVPIEKTEELWGRMNAAKDTFYSNRRASFETQKVTHEDNYVQKLALIRRAEVLAEGDVNPEASREMNELMDEWKRIGPVPKEVNNSSWAQFQEARQKFFDRKKDHQRLQGEWYHQNQQRRIEQTRGFLETLQRELSEEEEILNGYRENLTALPEEDEDRRKQMRALIHKSEHTIARRLAKIEDVQAQLDALLNGRPVPFADKRNSAEKAESHKNSDEQPANEQPANEQPADEQHGSAE